MVIMETERLILRDYKESDLDNMHRLWSDKETMFYLNDILCHTIEDTAKYLKTGIENTDGHYFCIAEKGADCFIGSIGYTITDTTPLGKIVHMGYMMMPEYHGRGYMTEATKKVIEFAFTQNDCIRITTGCVREHDASRNVMEKAGFRKEAECIKAQYHDGLMKDRLEYAINKDEWQEKAVDLKACCICPNADCPRHNDCEACLAHHDGNGYCKRSSISYTKDMNRITENMLGGFFDGWPNPPSPATHLKILRSSYRAIVAIDIKTNKAVGFINAVSDGVLSAYIPLLEVNKAYQGKGIGKWLVSLMIKECKDLYMTDICHDEELTQYYTKFEPTGQTHSTLFRNYAAQSGRSS